MKSQIITKLQEFNYNNGIVFLNPEEAEQYYKELVELVEKLIEENRIGITKEDIINFKKFSLEIQNEQKNNPIWNQ